VEENIAALEHAKYCIGTTSGMSSIITVLSLLKTGEHLICNKECYGGIQLYIDKVLCPKYGVEVSYVDLKDLT
jgi:cystathionine beta-lyase/cystathionine gamma-synthase